MTSNTNNDDASQQFCVRWNSHLGSLGAAFPQLLAGQQFVDVTLACEGHQLHCHRLVLAACSSFFESLLGESPCKHPIIILPRDIKLWEIQALVDFMYKGEVNVSQAGLTDLLKCADILQIRGLSGNDSTTIKDTTTTAPAATIDNNLIQNDFITTNDGLALANQQNQQQIESNYKLNNKQIITTELQQQPQSLINNNNSSSTKLITTNMPPCIPISTLSSPSTTLSNNNNNHLLINSLISSDINSDIISITSSSTLQQSRKLLNDIKNNTINNQQEQQNKLTTINQYDENINDNENNIKNNNEINNELIKQLNLSSSSANDIINKNTKNQSNYEYNDNTLSSRNSSTTIIPSNNIINDNNIITNNTNFDNCNKQENNEFTTTTGSIKHEHVQNKNNIKNCNSNNNNNNESGHSSSSHTVANSTNILPIIPKTEPFDTNIYDESMDDTILNDHEINVDIKSNNHDFPLSNVVCEYDSNGLQINMETPGRRVRRSESILRQAAECVSKGQTFQTVSDMFSIPISTIRFFMARKGILPRRKRGRTAGMTVIGNNVGIISGINNNNIRRNSTTIGEIYNNYNNNINIENNNSRSESPLEPPFHFATYKLPELKPKLL